MLNCLLKVPARDELKVTVFAKVHYGDEKYPIFKICRVTWKERSADIYPYQFEKCYKNATVTKQPSEHFYLSHATFPFPRDRFLRPAVVYSSFLPWGK
jgi:hypothetical protein